MLSEERIIELSEISPIWYAIPQGIEKFLLTVFARRIEREAYKQGQERMRERAVSQAAAIIAEQKRSIGALNMVIAGEGTDAERMSSPSAALAASGGTTC